MQIPELTTSWHSVWWTVRINALVDHGGLPIRAAMNWSHSSLRTPAVCYIINWRPCTLIWQHLHLIACCLLFLPSLILRTIFRCASRVMFVVAAFAVSQWSRWGLHCSWVSVVGVLEEAPVVLLKSVPPSPCWGDYGAMICCCGSEEMTMTKRSGKSWGRSKPKQVGSPEEYIVSFKSKWHAKQPTWLFYTRLLLLRIAACCTDCQLACDLHQVTLMLCVWFQGSITVNDHRNLMIVW